VAQHRVVTGEVIAACPPVPRMAPRSELGALLRPPTAGSFVTAAAAVRTAPLLVGLPLATAVVRHRDVAASPPWLVPECSGGASAVTVAMRQTLARVLAAPLAEMSRVHYRGAEGESQRVVTLADATVRYVVWSGGSGGSGSGGGGSGSGSGGSVCDMPAYEALAFHPRKPRIALAAMPRAGSGDDEGDEDGGGGAGGTEVALLCAWARPLAG